MKKTPKSGTLPLPTAKKRPCYPIITESRFVVDGQTFTTLQDAQLHSAKLVAKDSLLDTLCFSSSRSEKEDAADNMLEWLTDRKTRHVVLELLDAIDQVTPALEDL